MLSLSRNIDRINIFIGRIAAWAILFAVLFAVYNALVRKFAINLYSNIYVDAQWQLFSVAFLLCAPWTLFLNEHIRVDIVNEKLPQKLRHWIDIIGHSFILIPFCFSMVYISWPWAMKAYNIQEQSAQFGGLPYWPIKFLLPIAFLLLMLQGISELIKRIYTLSGILTDPDFKDSDHNTNHPVLKEATDRNTESSQ